MAETTKLAIRAQEVQTVSYSDYTKTAETISSRLGNSRVAAADQWPAPGTVLLRRYGHGFWDDALQAAGLRLPSSESRFTDNDFFDALDGFTEECMGFEHPMSIAIYDRWVFSEASMRNDRPSAVEIVRRYGSWASAMEVILPQEEGRRRRRARRGYRARRAGGRLAIRRPARDPPAATITGVLSVRTPSSEADVPPRDVIGQVTRSFLAGDPLRCIADAAKMSSWELLHILGSRVADRGEERRSRALRNRCNAATGSPLPGARTFRAASTEPVSISWIYPRFSPRSEHRRRRHCRGNAPDYAHVQGTPAQCLSNNIGVMWSLLHPSICSACST